MQMYMRAGVVAVFLVAVVLAGCSKKQGQGQPSSPQQAAQKPAAGVNAPTAPAAKNQAPSATAPSTSGAPSVADYAKMAEENRQKLTEMNQGKAIEAVAPAVLKDLLPAELPGMKRTNASAEKNEAMGFNVSNATGQYAPEGGSGSVRIKLSDVGNLSGPMRMGMVGWSMAQFSRETDTGYEKTTTFGGYKAVEKYNTQDKRGSLRVIVAERFLVEIEGSGVTMDTMKEMLGKVDFKKLAAAGA